MKNKLSIKEKLGKISIIVSSTLFIIIALDYFEKEIY